MNEEQIELLKAVRALRIEADEYIDKLPHDLAFILIDNGYANAVSMIGDKTLKMIFGDMYEEISWFLYEFKPKDTPQIWLADKTPIIINSDEDYYEYLRKYC